MRLKNQTETLKMCCTGIIVYKLYHSVSVSHIKMIATEQSKNLSVVSWVRGKVSKVKCREWDDLVCRAFWAGKLQQIGNESDSLLRARPIASAHFQNRIACPRTFFASPCDECVSQPMHATNCLPFPKDASHICTFAFPPDENFPFVRHATQFVKQNQRSWIGVTYNVGGIMHLVHFHVDLCKGRKLSARTYINGIVVAVLLIKVLAKHESQGKWAWKNK